MCGCGRRNISPHRNRYKPTVGPRSVKHGLASRPSPATLRALNLQSQEEAGNKKHMDANRLRIERLRRMAIQNKLGK